MINKFWEDSWRKTLTPFSVLSSEEWSSTRRWSNNKDWFVVDQCSWCKCDDDIAYNVEVLVT
jgi:hypothetical protein